ncbi:unnamed protein product [Dovyalis caffra]|uniref:Uncharacterized protein n=1 Tax=Dovyalis caffra TaxID=77055 RepID=A0AAV1SI41_9ROSI|nr:unnamed protein product [Dovyalis caffra]
MASRKKQLEGIALLSVYNDDEEDDEEMEDLNNQQPTHQLDQSNDMEEDSLNDDTAMVTEEEAEAATNSRNSTPQGGLLRPLTPQQQQQQQQGGGVRLETKRSSRRGRFAIVDYGHDEVAMSPEPEEGEFEEELQSANGVIQEKLSPGAAQILSPSVRATPQSSEHLETSQPCEINDTTSQSDAVNTEGANEVPAEGVNLLDKFLPPPPKEKCPEELQDIPECTSQYLATMSNLQQSLGDLLCWFAAVNMLENALLIPPMLKKIDKFLALKKIGRSFNAEVRNRKDYRNPDFLLHAVRYQDIDQIGSCFSKDVFDPHGYDQSDYYLDLAEADMRRERERKEQELKRSPKVEFVQGGLSLEWLYLQQIVSASGIHSSSNAADPGPREGRQNKKSKWDKVDGDGRNPLPTGGQDSLAAAAAQAALLSAANVGSGYTVGVDGQPDLAGDEQSGGFSYRCSLEGDAIGAQLCCVEKIILYMYMPKIQPKGNPEGNNSKAGMARPLHGSISNAISRVIFPGHEHEITSITINEDFIMNYQRLILFYDEINEGGGRGSLVLVDYYTGPLILRHTNAEATMACRSEQ